MPVIRYIAPHRGGWSHRAGSFAQGTRGYVRALETAGFQVWLDSLCKEDSEMYRLAQTQGPEIQAVERLALAHDRPDVLVVSAFATEIPDLGELRCAYPYQACILQTTFETLTPSREILTTLRKWDAIFVPSTWNRDCLLAAKVPNVYAIPHVVPPEWKNLFKLPPPRQKAFTFGLIGTWEPRKGGEVAVRAFVDAFAPGQAKLIIKCSKIDWHPYPTPQQCVEKIAHTHSCWKSVNWREHIEIRDDVVSREKLFELYGELDVLVSTSHGEGFCLPVLEAKLAGRRVVATDSGGPRDIVTKNDYLIEGKLGVCKWASMYGWPEGSMWFDHDSRVVAHDMRMALERPPPPPYDWSRFKPERVGQQLRAMVEETLARNEARARVLGLEWP